MLHPHNHKEIELTKDFIDDVVKLYNHYFNGAIYNLDFDYNIVRIDGQWNVNVYKKGSYEYNRMIGKFITYINHSMMYVYDHSILVCDEFIIDPRLIRICDYDFSFKLGDVVNDDVTINIHTKPYLNRHDFPQHFEFICEYEYLLIKHFFKYHGDISYNDADEIIVLCEQHKLPLDLFFVKEYEDALDVKSDSIKITFDDIDITVYNDDVIVVKRTIDKNNKKSYEIPYNDFLQINHLIRKYGG